MLDVDYDTLEVLSTSYFSVTLTKELLDNVFVGLGAYHSDLMKVFEEIFSNLKIAASPNFLQSAH